MNLDDLKPTWQGEDFSGPKFDEYAASIRQRGRTFEAHILSRDRIEMVSAIFVILAAIPGILNGPNWMFRLGFVFVVVGTIEVIAVMTWARKKDRLPAVDLPLREYCDVQLRRIDRQIWLTERVLWWYLLPLMIGAPLVFFSVPTHWVFQGIVVGAVLAICIYVYRRNQQGAKLQLRPLRDSFAAVLDQLDSDAPLEAKQPL
jgi:hypothetical protein